MDPIKDPVLNILVVGFHHKKGCQVEYCYPSLVPGNPTELPPEWRHLPALALPDGSHNYLSDTIFFHLPSLNEPSSTVYAISCFRQIPVEQVTQRTSDMTRSSVQKSVCIVSRIPFFGRLAVKMELVARAWFMQGDFAQTQLLHDAFKNLNNCPIQQDQCFEGLSATFFIDQWRHKILLLFKLLLLQKKIVLHGTPAGPVTSNLLTLLSLLPECIQSGLSQSANVVLSRPLSPTPVFNTNKNEDVDSAFEATSLDSTNNHINNTLESNDIQSENKAEDDNLLVDMNSDPILQREKSYSISEPTDKDFKPLNESQNQQSITRDLSVDGLNQLVGKINLSECGFPLQLFTDGYLCLPYLCLQYLDLLADPAVKGFVIGASNVLFKQKRHLFDILIEVNELRIETSDLSLKRQLQLSTEDLRFADHLVRHGTSQGDTWIREQFSNYLLYLLRVSLLPEGSRELDSYNALFMSAFKETPVYKKWLVTTNHGAELMQSTVALHPFGGQLSVADMKLRLAHSISSTEGGRRMTAAVQNTGRAVGAAVVTARASVAGWWAAVTAKAETALEGATNNIGSLTQSSPDAEDIEVGEETRSSDSEEGIQLENSSKSAHKIQVV